MGAGITAHEDESLAVSGNIYAHGFLLHAEEQLMDTVTTANTIDLLRGLSSMRVVEYSEPPSAPSRQSGTETKRTLGLLEAADASAREGVSISGVAGRVRSLDLRVVVAQAVGVI